MTTGLGESRCDIAPRWVVIASRATYHVTVVVSHGEWCDA